MPANYVLLQRVELNANAQVVILQDIPQSGYTDLLVTMSTRCDYAGIAAGVYLYINSNAIQTDSWKRLYGNGGTVISDSISNDFAIGIGTTNGATSTSNTFNNCSMYIPNYSQTVAKSVSVDNVTENNGATSYQEIVAGLRTTTAPITSLYFTAGGYNFIPGSTFDVYGISAIGTTPILAPKATGGNSIVRNGNFWIHTFTSSGVFTPQANLQCDYLVVAGGGGGGNHAAGGGGAGGLRSTIDATGGGGSLESPLSTVNGTAYIIQVGAGGAGLTSQGISPSTAGNNGTNSIFSTITATGGGGGGAISATAGKTGGSGGGGGGATTASGGLPISNQGFAGGSATASQSGGGGGAGVAGSTPNGGNGITTAINGITTTYAGGGGGAGSSSAGTGGAGGGGNGGTNNATNNTAGTVNTGGGGGGQWYSPSGAGPYGAGGSGIVIIRYIVV
jgi:hypothetical protein